MHAGDARPWIAAAIGCILIVGGFVVAAFAVQVQTWRNRRLERMEPVERSFVHFGFSVPDPRGWVLWVNRAIGAALMVIGALVVAGAVFAR